MLTDGERLLLEEARHGVLATIATDGRPRIVPFVFAAFTGRSKSLVLYSALDEKPKSVSDPRSLARVRDILERPRVSVLVERWSEDWSQLAWLRLEGQATLLEPGDEHTRAVALLRERYTQYASHNLEPRPVLRIGVERAVSWGVDK
ncbi:MAG: TIGR03668 family PPOX class F420-dependent oxidoreductase [Candidatus Limnocylindrales bacterium]